MGWWGRKRLKKYGNRGRRRVRRRSSRRRRWRNGVQMTMNGSTDRMLSIRVLRQDAPEAPSRWERHRIPYEPNLNVISVLQKIAAQATTADGKKTAPVAWDCNCLEE